MKRVRVLIIDDEEGILLVIQRMLDELGVTVLTARSFAEAIRVMSEIPPPDFIFLDLGLPDTKNKVHTLEHIPDLQVFNPSAPIVVLTGSPDIKMEQISQTLGADAYRRKHDLSSQRDLWLAMREAIDYHMSKGASSTEAITKIKGALIEKLAVTGTTL